MGSGVAGLILARPRRLAGIEPFFMDLIGGLEEAVNGRGLSVLSHIVTNHDEEIDAYRRWSVGGVADVVVVLNVVDDDKRPDVLAELGIPAVIVGEWTGEPEFASVGMDNRTPMREVAQHLLELGHSNIAYVAGPATFVHTGERIAELVDVCARARIRPVVVEGDYTAESGRVLTRRLLTADVPPTAIIYGNDVMALAGLVVADVVHVPVPGRLSLVAWDDSTACRLSHPPLTVVAVDVHEYGTVVGEAVLDVLDAAPMTRRLAPLPRWIGRGSTGVAPS